MLGSNEVKTIYNSYNSVYAQPKVVAEWNANMFAEPYVAAGGNFGAITDNPVYKTASNAVVPAQTILFTDLSFTNKDAVRISFEAYSSTPVEATVTLYKGGVDSKSTTINVGINSQRYTVDYFSYDPEKMIEFTSMYLGFESGGQSINVSSIEMYKISRYDARNSNEFPVDSLYIKRLGGEAFVDNSSLMAIMLPNNSNIYPHNIIYSGFSKELTADNSQDLCRNFIPSKFSKNKYFIMDRSVDGDVFIKYKTLFKMNKLVLKANSAHDIPESISFSLLFPIL
jgi:hypothetical protein